MRTHHFRTAGPALAALTLTACGSSGGSQAVIPDQPLRPAMAESGWSATEVKGVTVDVPASWQKTGPITPGPGATMFTFQTGTNRFGTRGGAQLATFDQARQNAHDTVRALRDEAVAVAGAKQITITKVNWPGAEVAWFMTYVAYPPRNGKVAPHPTEVLVADIDGGGQTQVTVTALKADFGPQHMHRVLGTVHITP